MNSIIGYLSSKLGHTLRLKEDDSVAEDDTCVFCKQSTAGSPAYICVTSHDDLDCRDFYLHQSCAEIPIVWVDYHDHALKLKEDDYIISEDATCYVCNIPIIASSPPTYTCKLDHNIICQNFYVHKSCAELPSHLIHHKHNKHTLALLPVPDHNCDVCYRVVKFAYRCVDCDFDVCVFCASEQRELRHRGHQEHPLTLMPRESLFTCDACFEEAKDSSYVCTICDFWIHKRCAISPSTIQAPTHHHHPLNLIYSIPDMHRYFERICGICGELTHKNYWVYYCHKCTYFVHMKCATSSVSIINETEADAIDNEPDLVQFPLPSEDSLFDLIITQFGKLKVENDTAITRTPTDPLIIERHWSHPNHSLEHLHITTTENDNDDNDADPVVLICDGCIQPITVFHPSYYACIQCGFFLHSFCAMKLPPELPLGASPFHPQHSLYLSRSNTNFSLVKCGACDCFTNGFFYHCKTCDINVDIRCALLPTRIKHTSHKHHSLVQRPFSKPMCSVTRLSIDGGVEYGCEICSDFQISIHCAFLASKIKHRYDADLFITLRLPPFFYEGVFYCEICEEQVNNQWLLYHCDESDHSFHHFCLNILDNIKLGGIIELEIDNQSHTFTFVLKLPLRKGFEYRCSGCRNYFSHGAFFECYGCGYLSCHRCFIDVLGECSGDESIITA